MSDWLKEAWARCGHDISHCRGAGCSRRETCYRYLMAQKLKPGMRVSFVAPDPDNCECYWVVPDGEGA